MFSGNPLDYCTFIRAFETVIETRESDYARRLYYLEQHTAGRPQELARSCLYMNPEAGYLKARKLLESQFGQKHKIAMVYVDKVTNGPAIKAEDAEALENFSTLLASCTNTLKAIGYSSKFESPDCMWKLIERLPPKLQASWRDNADRILNIEGRDICIETFPCSLSRMHVLCPIQSLENSLSWKRKRRITETEVTDLNL